jgi:hypothetical protein
VSEQGTAAPAGDAGTVEVLRALVRSLDALLTLEQEHDRATHAADESLGRTYGNKTCHVCAAVDQIWFALKEAQLDLKRWER